MSILRDQPLHALNTFGLPCQAAGFIYLENLAQLVQLTTSDDWANWTNKPKLLLGGGSNLLLCDDFDGLVIQVALKGIEVTQSEDDWLLHVAAGESWHQLVRYTLEHGMPGLENLALIPGTVGAAPIQNIGAYGVEFANFCDYVDVFDMKTSQTRRLTAEQCHFAYRDSIFKRELKDNCLITAVGLRLPKAWQAAVEYRLLREALSESPTPLQIFETVCAVRQSKLPDPKLLGNAGSFFKNPVVAKDHWVSLKSEHPELPGWEAGDDQIKVPAGWLIDKAGLKGFRQGQVGVHSEQALVLVNHGEAQAQDLVSLAEHVTDTVKQRYGITLSPEVRFIGTHGEVQP